MTEAGSLVGTLAVAFAGGVFGASIGGVAAFAACGLLALLSVAIRLAGGDPGVAATLTWGPFLGPQAAFVGAVGAAAFAASRGLLDSGRDVVTPLAARGSATILLAGGAWGVAGQALFEAARAGAGGLGPRGVSMGPDAMAVAVALATLAVRAVHGGELLSRPPAGGSRLRPAPEDRWLPWQSRPGQILVLALGVAAPAAWIGRTLPAASGIVFALSATSLLLFVAGRHPPVTLHMALAAESAVALWGGWLVPLVAAAVCGLLAELFARLWLVSGDTHVDPPAWAIATTSLLLALGAVLVPPAP